MILPYQHIKERCIYQRMIEPFYERAVAHGMTYGCGPAGYDVRIREDVTLAPGAFQLASTLESFRIPNDLLMLVHDKSTFARRGLSLFNTVGESGWEGVLTLELLNTSDQPLTIRSGSPIAQCIFMKLAEATERPYPPDAKYQFQKPGPQPAIFEIGETG